MSDSGRSIRRVLVTGATGNIGRAVTSELVHRGVEVVALALDGEPSERVARLVLGDATDPDTVGEALDGVDAVVHLAAIPHPGLGTPFEVFRTNSLATWSVLSQSGAHGVGRVVLASSINATGIPFNPHRPMPAYFPIDEDLPVDLGDAYSLSKSVDEAAARTAHRMWGLDVVAIRFPLIKDRATLDAAAREARADPGKSVREGWSYLDVRDGAVAVRQALESEVAGAHVVLVAADDTLLGGSTAEHLARWAPGVPITGQLTGAASAVDTTRARELFGFRAEHSVHRDERGAVA